MSHGVPVGWVIRGLCLVGLLGWASLAGCGATCPTRAEATAAGPLTPAGHITHVVLFDLVEGTDADSFIQDCRDLLAPIPGVTSLSCGRHFDTGRDIVLGDYDVGVSVGLASASAYQDYLTHPNHLALLERWGPTIASYRIYDIQDTPAG